MIERVNCLMTSLRFKLAQFTKINFLFNTTTTNYDFKITTNFGILKSSKQILEI